MDATPTTSQNRLEALNIEVADISVKRIRAENGPFVTTQSVRQLSVNVTRQQFHLRQREGSEHPSSLCEWLRDGQHLPRGDAGHFLLRAAGPMNFDAIDAACRAEAEVEPEIVDRVIARLTHDGARLPLPAGGHNYRGSDGGAR
jgi:hypothetical protein